MVEQLAVAAVLIALTAGTWQVAVMAVSLPLATASSVSAYYRHRTSFTAFAGSQLVFQCCACVLATGLGYAGAWFVLGLGLACLLIGDQALLSSRLYAGTHEGGLSSKGFLSATVRSFWRILVFMALVMISSLLVLFMILAMNVGSLPFPLLLIVGLLAMVCLYYLATRRTTAGDEEKPNI